MGQPLVTILMNSRNAPHYLAAELRSLLWQSHTNLEVIVSEASDDDAAVRVIEAFADPRVTIVRDTDRLGWAHGVNRIASRAHGEFVMFAADDDIFHPQAIERMVAALEGSGAGTAVVAVRGVDEQGVPTGRTLTVPAHVRAEPTWVRLFERNYIILGLSRREVLPSPPLDASIAGVGADWHLWLQLVLRGTGFTYIDEPLFDYRVHGASLVATAADTREDMRRILRRIEPEVIRDAYSRSALPSAVVAEGLADVAIARGDYDQAWTYWNERAASTGDPAAAARAGAVGLMIGDDEAAVRWLRSAVHPDAAPDVWNNLGVALARIGDATATACFQEALRQFPEYRDASENLSSRFPRRVTDRPLRPLDQILR